MERRMPYAAGSRSGLRRLAPEGDGLGEHNRGHGQFQHRDATADGLPAAAFVALASDLESRFRKGAFLRSC